MKLTEILNEAGLSKIWDMIQSHDIVVITGFRYKIENCRKEQVGRKEGDILNKSANSSRNRMLYSKILMMGYSGISINSSFKENFNTDEVSENSFFVVNLKNNPSFVKNMLQLSIDFCQDYSLVHLAGTKNFYFVGTNNAKYPGYLKRALAGTTVEYGIKDRFMSKIRDRSFAIINPKKPDENARLESIFQSYKNTPHMSKQIIIKCANENVCKK